MSSKSLSDVGWSTGVGGTEDGVVTIWQIHYIAVCMVSIVSGSTGHNLTRYLGHVGLYTVKIISKRSPSFGKP